MKERIANLLIKRSRKQSALVIVFCLFFSLCTSSHALVRYNFQSKSDFYYKIIPHDSYYASNKYFSFKLMLKEPNVKVYLDPAFAWYNAKLIGSDDVYRFHLPQAYLRLKIDPIGTISIGKIKINTAYPSVFNPLSYENQLSLVTNASNLMGRHGLSWETFFTYDAGIRLYAIENNGLVVTLFDHIVNSDYGVVGIRKEDGSKVIGGYLKGDFEIGVEAAAGYFLTQNNKRQGIQYSVGLDYSCLLYTSPSPRDVEESRMPSSA